MIDPDTGEISERCSQIIKACDSYTELSPSGKGVHIICSGETETFKSNKVGIEVFAGRQYFTFTGKPWPGTPSEIRPLNDLALRRLRATVKGSKATATPRAPAPSAPTAPTTAHGGRQRSLAESVALAEEALQHLDADDYQQWIDIGMACKAGLGERYGFMVWDAWSARSSKYAGSQDTEKRWEGFQPTQLTLGTVFGLAEAAGWVSPWAKARARKPRARKEAAAPPDDAPPLSAAGGGDGGLPPSDAPAGEMGSPPGPPPDDDWPRDLLRVKGDVSPCLANAELILSHARVADVIGCDDSRSERCSGRRCRATGTARNRAIGPITWMT
ncbi:MAG: PriCT-2 domain-containing protein [Rhodospirillaceae bacterium]|nr:PriCT-2 domain-containing protein [Rhodospirillaceae bacterium]